MYGILRCGIPRANLILPTINLDSFEQLNYTSQGYLPVGAGSLEMATRNLVANSNLKMKAAQAQRKLQEARLELEAIAQDCIQMAQTNRPYQLIIPILCAILAIPTAFAIAFWRLGPDWAALFGAILIFFGFYASLKRRAEEQFLLANAVMEEAISKLYDSLDIVEYQLLGPLEELNRTIEAMAREQKAGLENGKATKKDVASTIALKDPLAGYDSTLANALLTARWELSDLMDSIWWNSSWRIRLPASRSLWNVLFVTISCDVLFIINAFVGIALGQLLAPPHVPYDYVARHIRTFRKAAQNATLAQALNITVATAAAAAALLEANHAMSVEAAIAAGNQTSATPRLLKGHGHNRGRSGPLGTETEGPQEFHGVILLGAPAIFTGAGSMPSWDVTLRYLLPVCFEILVSTIELLTIFFLSRTSRTIALANYSIAAIQDAINGVLTNVTGPVVEQLNLQFRVVRWQADSIFNELKDLKG